jgi:hypothetical protein
MLCWQRYSTFNSQVLTLFPSKRRGTRWWAALGGHLRYPVARYRAILRDAPARAACKPSPCDHVLDRLGSSRGYSTSACGTWRAHTPALRTVGLITVRPPMHAGPMGSQPVPLTSSAPTGRPHLSLPTSTLLRAAMQATRLSKQQMRLPRC